jgi:restriction system protein
MAIWLVRAGGHGQYESKFLSEGRAYLTWDGLTPDLSKFHQKDDLMAQLEQTYPDDSTNRLRNWRGQIWAFVKRIEVGDWIVLPSKTKPAIHIGKVKSDYQHIPDGVDPYFHFRTVDWFAQDIPRSNFDQDILYSFGAFMTVCQIKRNNAEQRIKAMATNGWRVTDTQRLSEPVDTDEDASDDQAPTDLTLLARDQIAKLISAKFRGHDLTRLVEAVLKAQGYFTFRSPEGPDKGVDILAAPTPLGFGEPKVCVQVKSGDTALDRPTLDQLVGVMQNVQATYGLVVSWSGFKTTVDKEISVQFFRVRLWDRDDLLDSVLEHYDRLDQGIKGELPLRQVWMVNLSDD